MNKQFLLDTLDQLLIDVLNGKYPNSGICKYYWDRVKKIYGIEFFYTEGTIETSLWPIFETWEHYSGDTSYPVPTSFIETELWVNENYIYRVSLLCHCIRELYLELLKENQL